MKRTVLIGFIVVFALANAQKIEATQITALDKRQKVLEPLWYGPCVKYGTPMALAIAIARQESGLYPWAVNVAGRSYTPKSKEEALEIARRAAVEGQSFDVGLMQINSYWLRRYNLKLEAVIEPSANVIIGVWILSQEIKRYGLNWKAVASYHTPLSKNPERGRIYAGYVYHHLLKVQGIE